MSQSSKIKKYYYNQGILTFTPGELTTHVELRHATLSLTVGVDDVLIVVPVAHAVDLVTCPCDLTDRGR